METTRTLSIEANIGVKPLVLPVLRVGDKLVVDHMHPLASVALDALKWKKGKDEALPPS